MTTTTVTRICACCGQPCPWPRGNFRQGGRVRCARCRAVHVSGQVCNTERVASPPGEAFAEAYAKRSGVTVAWLKARDG